jgi:Ser/Thr protein kinase RdoA (MazF antagonist)
VVGNAWIGQAARALALIHSCREELADTCSVPAPRYDHTSLDSSWTTLSHQLLDHDVTLPADLAVAVGTSLRTLQGLLDDPAEVGPMHADFHADNLVQQINRVGVVDFARSGEGPQSLDVAMAMHYLPEAEATAFLTEYRQARPLSEAALTAMPALLLLAAVDNFATLAAMPSEISGLIADLPYLGHRAADLSV